MSQERRVFTRMPYGRSVRWHDAQRESGTGLVVDVSRSGFSISFSRYLRPGPIIVFTFDDVPFENRLVEIAAVTIWCRPTQTDRERFNAGFLVVQGEPHTLPAMSEVFYAALAENTARPPQ